MGGKTTRQLPENSDLESKRGQSGRLHAGTLLQSRYRILSTLGVGGFSSVYQARDMHFPAVTRLCAVKEMIHLNRDPEVRQMATSSFEREASILATLNHPAVPDVYDYFTEDDRSYLVLEYIRGKTLESLLADQEHEFTTQTVMDWALQLCDVLAYLHSHSPQPVVFRDLKPSNIMLDPYGRIRLIDFNIAKSFQTGVRGTMIGTEGYSPPEQYRGDSSPAGDVYALGATLHHLLSRQDPRMEPPFSFNERPIREVNSEVPPAFESVIERCLSYDVADRYRDAMELRQALLAVSGEVRTGQPAPGFFAADGARRPGQVAGAKAARQSQQAALWTFRCEDEIRSTAAVDKGVVYVGAYDNNIYALKSESGSFIWKYPSSDGIASSPCVNGSHVFVGSSDNYLYCLRQDNGRMDWRFETGGPIHSSPRADFGHVFFGSDDGYFYAVNATSGRQVWRTKVHHMVRSTACIRGERIFFGTEGGYVYCLDFTGQVKWQFQARRAVTSSPAFAEDIIFVGSMDSTVYAVDANSGWALWRFRARRPIVSSPAVDQDTVYIGASDGNLYALDIFSGRKIWQFETGGQISAAPVVWEEGVYFGSTDGSVYCVESKRAKLRWRFETGGIVVASPTVADGVLYIGSCDHHLYALPA